VYGVFFTPLSSPTYDRLAPLGVAPDVAPSVARDFADGYQHLDDLQEWFNHSAPTKCSAAYKRWLAGRAYVHRAGDMTHQQPGTNADRRLVEPSSSPNTPYTGFGESITIDAVCCRPPKPERTTVWSVFVVRADDGEFDFIR
jgi:hypothetical protein